MRFSCLVMQQMLRSVTLWENIVSKRALHVASTFRQDERGQVEDSDNFIKSLVSKTMKMRDKEANTDWRAIFLPNSRHFLFEAAQGIDDYVVLREHTGPTNWRHNGKTCSIADLAMNAVPAKDNNLMDTIFQQQLKVVKQTFDEEKDGSLNFTAKFGHLYLVDSVPGRSLHILDFNEAIRFRRHDRNVIRTSFTPSMTPSQHIINVLFDAGFRETGQDESVVVSLDHRLKNRWLKRFEVYLDEYLNFKSLRLPDRCFMNIDIRRKDPNKPDIRLAVKSLEEEFNKEKIQFPGLLYAQDHIVMWDEHQGLLLDQSVIGKVTLARHKLVTSYKLAPEKVSSKLEQVIEVKMMETTYYEGAQLDGSFSSRNKLTEVYVCINGKDQLYEVCEEKNFLQNLMRFCDKFQ